MIEFKNAFFFLELESFRYTKTLDLKCGQIIREGAREWLRAVIKRVPVQTGAARSTLIPLSRVLREPFAVTPVRKWDRRALGESKNTFTVKDDRTNPMSFVYEFSWSSDLVWYEINEYQKAIFGHRGVNPYPVASAPWHSLEAGRDAFFRHINTTMQHRLPKFVDFFGFKDGDNWHG